METNIVGIEKRFATEDELKELQRQFIACQPKGVVFPEINPQLKFSYSQLFEYFDLLIDPYIEARQEFIQKLRGDGYDMFS